MHFEVTTNNLYTLCRYVCDHLRNHDSKDVQLRVHYLSQLVALEESCVEAVELAELLIRQGVSLSTRLTHK